MPTAAVQSSDSGEPRGGARLDYPTWNGCDPRMSFETGSRSSSDFLRRLGFALACAGISALPSAAQDSIPPTGYDVTVWSIAEGLPQSSVNSIVQATSGELWLATFGGLASFDGVRFRCLDMDTSAELPSQRLTAALFDDQGALWVATQNNGLVKLRDGRVIATLSKPPASGEILALALDGAQNIWVCSSTGRLYRYADEVWSQPIGDVFPGSYGSLCRAGDGTIWAAHNRELLRFDENGAVVQRTQSPALIQSIAIDGSKACWLGTNAGPARLRGNAIEILSVEPALPAPTLIVLPVDDDHVWAGSAQGPRLLVRDAASARFLQQPLPRGLPASFGVRWMLRDREGNVWIGSSTDGLARLTPQCLREFSISAPARPASALIGAAGGDCFIAAECDGVARVNRDGTLVEMLALPSANGKAACAYSLLSDSRGRLWIGAQGQLLRQEDEEIRLLPLELSGARVSHIVEDSVGAIWLVTSDGLLWELDAEGRELNRTQIEIGTSSLVSAPDGSLWLGGDGVLVRFDHGSSQRFGPEQGMPRGNIRDVLFDDDGSVWIAAYGGGLGHLVDGQVTRIAREQGLPDASLTRIFDDGLGRMWLLSNAGLIIVLRSELAELSAASRRELDPILLGPESGISEARFGAPAGFKDEDGSLFFGTIRGGVRIDPWLFPFNRLPPATRIEQLLCDERLSDITDNAAKVPPGTRRLRFDFTAFALSVPKRVHFSYRVEGFDPRWIDVGPQRSVEYSALSPGLYTFEVVARNEHGVWSTQPASLRFEVLPMWWQRRWVQACALLAVLLALFILHRLRVAAVDRRGQVLLAANEGRRVAEARESRMREELAHMSRVATAGELATSLAHEVNQPLAAIVANASAARHLLLRDGAKPAELAEILKDIARQGERASEVIRRMREFLRKRESERKPVSIEEIVRSTLPLVRRELDEQCVQLNLEIEPDLPQVIADAVQLQQVLVNLIKNACEAMSNASGLHRIVISASKAAGRVQLQVRDNGPGLAPGVEKRLFEPYVTTKTGGMGLGLAICRTIVEAHGGRLSASPADAGGVVFRFDLPTQSS